MKYNETFEPMFIDEQGILSYYDLDHRHRDKHPEVYPDIAHRHSWGLVAARWTDWTFVPGFKSVFPPHVKVGGWVEVLVPFCGLYESIHDNNLDRALEQMFSDDTGDTYEDLVQASWDDIDWGNVHRDYAKLYCEAFFNEAGVKGHFKKMVSPREYNFGTDRIFAEVYIGDLKRMLGHPGVMKETRKVAREWFTSRSGFISFYSPDVQSWGPLEGWDHNHWGAVVMAYANVVMSRGGNFDNDAEDSIMESDRCNGRFEDIIWQHMKNVNQHMAALDERRGDQ